MRFEALPLKNEQQLQSEVALQQQELIGRGSRFCCCLISISQTLMSRCVNCVSLLFKFIG